MLVCSAYDVLSHICCDKNLDKAQDADVSSVDSKDSSNALSKLTHIYILRFTTHYVVHSDFRILSSI